ncbi:MAG: excisionase family DNA binding protein [Alphaproteobacteria bacterium]|jgi:excisionase family DNA binding protein
MAENKYLTQPEAAEVLRLSERTLEKQRLEGNGPKFVKAGRRVLYRDSDLEAWLEERTFQSTTEAEAASSAA